MASSPKLFRKDEVEGKVVVETSGRSIGKASDIAFSLEGTMALIVMGYDGAEIQIAMERVTGVGDFIVVRRDKGDPIPTKTPIAATVPSAPAVVTPMSTARATIPVTSPPPPPPTTITSSSTISPPPPPPSVTTTCKTCGATLRAGARFCTKCGSAV